MPIIVSDNRLCVRTGCRMLFRRRASLSMEKAGKIGHAESALMEAANRRDKVEEATKCRLDVVFLFGGKPHPS